MLKINLFYNIKNGSTFFLGNSKTTDMKATIFTFLFISIGLLSCKKKNVDPFNGCVTPPNPMVESTTTAFFSIKGWCFLGILSF